ncbi:HAD-IIIC family phosphatase [Paenibacillus pini]
MTVNLNSVIQTEQIAKIKCLVWDLDHTLWNGVLLEDGEVSLKEGVADIVKELDRRGILQSIASKNDYQHAMERLRTFGLDEYFLYPQIHWSAKSISIESIVKSLNIGMDTIAFIDDQPFERDEVKQALPTIRCYDAANIAELLDDADFNPEFVTDDSKQRRFMYRSDQVRKELEEQYEGPQEEFLASLQMKFTIAPVGPGDLQRAEELTVRTHQLNTTGYTYSYEELDALRQSPNHKLLIAGLDDIYGSYGKIGLLLLECSEKVWTLQLLLMSCRVMSRGVGSIMLNHVIRMAKEAGVVLQAKLVPNDRNRMMSITYHFAGFQEVERTGEMVLFEHQMEAIPSTPDYVDVQVQSL